MKGVISFHLWPYCKETAHRWVINQQNKPLAKLEFRTGLQNSLSKSRLLPTGMDSTLFCGGIFSPHNQVGYHRMLQNVHVVLEAKLLKMKLRLNTLIRER